MGAAGIFFATATVSSAPTILTTVPATQACPSQSSCHQSPLAFLPIISASCPLRNFPITAYCLPGPPRRFTSFSATARGASGVSVSVGAAVGSSVAVAGISVGVGAFGRRQGRQRRFSRRRQPDWRWGWAHPLAADRPGCAGYSSRDRRPVGPARPDPVVPAKWHLPQGWRPVARRSAASTPARAVCAVARSPLAVYCVAISSMADRGVAGTARAEARTPDQRESNEAQGDQPQDARRSADAARSTGYGVVFKHKAMDWHTVRAEPTPAQYGSCTDRRRAPPVRDLFGLLPMYQASMALAG